ncbi:hypothetical protein AT05_07015 [Schleiferia thermophila str. Yellowstone]|nr:hypothetical protein AT05_07015 [Schleiferia thermophila str. Yellowstone]
MVHSFSSKFIKKAGLQRIQLMILWVQFVCTRI